MADLTIGEIGVVLKVTLTSVDRSQNPPVTVPLNITGATVTLLYAIKNTGPNVLPKAPTSKTMTIVDPINGIVQYTFQTGDLAIPADMSQGSSGSFAYSIKVAYPGGNILYTDENVILSIKDESAI
jgi:hypothetical protein